MNVLAESFCILKHTISWFRLAVSLVGGVLMRSAMGYYTKSTQNNDAAAKTQAGSQSR